MLAGQRGVRFAPGPFKYNVQVACALGPALLVAALLGGQLVMGTLTLGAMVWYLMDAMQYREGAVTVGWATLVFASVGVVVSVVGNAVDRPGALTVLLCVCLVSSLLGAGMWLTVQFRWIQMQYPPVVLAFERMLLTAALPLGAALAGVGFAAVADRGDVPFYLAALLLALHLTLGRPMVSSFHAARGGGAAAVGGGAAVAPPREAIVQGKMDGFLLSLTTATLPLATYLAIHGPLLRHWTHLWSALLLGGVPLLYLATAPGALWWVQGPVWAVRALQRLMQLASVVMVIAGFEGRVVFHAFAAYIPLPAPWSFLAVSGALAGVAALGLAAAAAANGDAPGAGAAAALDPTLAGACLLLATAAGSLAAGVPFVWLPAPLAAAAALALYLDSRSPREYAAFVAAALLTLAWFVWHHFWFLDVRVGPMHLHGLTQLALAAAGAALAVPGLVLGAAHSGVTGALMMAQAELMCVLEEQLTAGHHHEEAGAEAMYPPYLVVATSAVGIAAAQRLGGAGAIARWASWVVTALYAGKLSMLVLPEAYLVLPTCALLLAATSPIYMHAPPAGKRRLRIAPWQGLAHVAANVAAVLLARFAVFDLVAWAAGGRPHEGVLVGALLVVMAAANAPLVARCYSGNQGAQRLLACFALSGLLLALLQPPMAHHAAGDCPKLPFALCLRLWDRRHVPLRDADDAAVWGGGVGRREHWPRWLLFGAALSGLAGLAGAGPWARAHQVRLLLGVAAGALVGEYLALEVVPAQLVLQALVIASSVMVVAFVTLLQNPTLGSPAWLPALAALWVATFGATMTLQAQLPLPDIHRFRRLFPDSGSMVQMERLAGVRAMLAGVFAAHALLMAFALKLRMASALRAADEGGAPSRNGPYSYADDPLLRHLKLTQSRDYFCGVLPARVVGQLGRAMNLPGAAGSALKRLGREGLAWVPTAGNLCTLLAFGIALHLNIYMTGGAPEAVFMLAPLLLLLSQDPLLLPRMGEAQRYFPPALAVSAYLAAAGALDVARASGADAGAGAALGCALALALPSHALCLRYLWTQRPHAPAGAAAALLLAGAGLWVGLASEPVAYLCATGLAMGALQFFAMRHVRHVGMKVV